MVNVTAKAVAAIIELGHTRAPSEACGLLLNQPMSSRAGGHEYEPLVVEIPNSSKASETSYEFTSDEARRIIDEMVDDALTFDDVIVWHTHPTNTAGPSEADLKHRDPRIKYLVVHLPTGQAFRY